MQKYLRDRLKWLMSGDEEEARRLSQNLPEEQVAVCAILLEVAEADAEFDPGEHDRIVALLKARFEMTDEEVNELIEVTETERAKVPDLWPFTNAIAKVQGPDYKRELLTMVWQVIFADDELSAYEDQLARRLQSMLSVNHSVLMDAKARARELQKANGG